MLRGLLRDRLASGRSPVTSLPRGWRTPTRCNANARRGVGSTPGPHSRIDRIQASLPRFLHHFTTPLRNAPVSHITAFLILHELTAIVPLFGLAALFHYADWLPERLAGNKYVQEGTGRFGRWMRKRGWITAAEEEEAEGPAATRGDEKLQGGVSLVLEFATAYAITKALLPVRLVGSVWFTPWFAKWTVVPLGGVVRRITGRGSTVKAAASPAAGTGAVGGNVLPPDAASKVK